MTTEKDALDVIKELRELQIKTGYYSDYDDQVLDAVCKVHSSVISLTELLAIRVEMWLYYVDLLLDEIENLLNNLLKNFAEVKEKNSKFSKLIERYDELFEESEKIIKNREIIKELQNLFNDVHCLFNEIRSDEIILIRDGKINFLTKVYSIVASLVSIAFWGISTAILTTQNIPILLQNILLLLVLWLVILIILYYCSRWYFGRGVRLGWDEKEV